MFTLLLLAPPLILGAYVVWRARHAIGVGWRTQLAMGIAIAAGACLVLVVRKSDGDPVVVEVLSVVGTAIALATVISAVLLSAVHAAGGVWRIFERRPGPPVEAPRLGRRDFVRNASTAALALGAGGGAYSTLFGRQDYAIEEVPIVLRALPRSLDGFTIVQLSDLHIGRIIGAHELRAAEALVREARPDLIVLTGDLLDSDAAFAPVLARFVRRLGPLARFGVSAVPGNHDHSAGAELVEDALSRAGAAVMTNHGRLVGDHGGAFALLGVDDLRGRRAGRGPDLERAIAEVPRDVPRVLLAHQPVFMEVAEGLVDLQLSGHTHGGQISAPGLADLVMPNGWARGRYDVGESVLYVNRGFGTWGPPARLFAPPEVTKIVLVAG
jgi:predicted MPP superfamily phosphohydrolase